MQDLEKTAFKRGISHLVFCT